MNRGPVFIGGLDRSGKTYLRLMLAAHPGFAVSKRTGLWTRFYNKFGDLARDADLDRCLGAMADHKHLRSLELDFQRLRRDFGPGPRSYARLFALIHEQYAERLGKPRWGDQTELLEEYAEIILSAYPEAVFIHLLRDPRDRYEAVLSKSPDRRGGIGAATARWLYSATLAERNREAFPSRYLVVRYETMVGQPEATMKNICNSLGEEYHPPMLKMGDAPRFAQDVRRTMSNGNIPSENSSRLNGTGSEGRCDALLREDYIGRFRDSLAAEEVAFIQQYAGRLMARFGYPLDPVRFSLAESARFYSMHWPLNSARLLGWRMRHLAAG